MTQFLELWVAIGAIAIYYSNCFVGTFQGITSKTFDESVDIIPKQ